MESRFKSLSLKTGSPAPQGTQVSKNKGKAPVADSWEDDDLSDGKLDDSEDDPSRATSMPIAPPPTPISPSFTQSSAWDMKGVAPYTGRNTFERRDDTSSRARPEKQTAVAGRLIAGALGVRAPKKTEDQRAYDRAVKEKEIKRRNRELEEATKRKEEEERARAAAWDS